jgi:hypothetical protein
MPVADNVSWRGCWVGGMMRQGHQAPVYLWQHTVTAGNTLLPVAC